MSGRRRSDRGAISIELALIAPMLILILGLIYAYGRVGNVNGILDSGARAAVRSATQESSIEGARTAAMTAMEQTIVDQAPPECVQSLQLDVEVARFGPGAPVTVRASCEYPLSWVLPGMPTGSMEGHAEFTSVLDVNREYD